MSIISPNPFGSKMNLSAESASIVKRFRNDNGDSITYSLGSGCNEDTDCPMGNLCIEGKCYYKCDNEGNDCPFWHTCRDDLHPSESVCSSYTQAASKAALPTKRINPKSSQAPAEKEDGFFSSIYHWIFG